MEMGIPVHPKSYQNKIVEGNSDFDTLELQNYIYTVTEPRLDDLNPTQPWADAEFLERVNYKVINPGEAWKLRPEVWDQFINEYDKFDYTYNQRMRRQLKKIMDELVRNPESRQLYLSIWDPFEDIDGLGGQYRVPCSLGYQFQFRQGQLHMTYMMRSSDLATHFENDVYLAHKLQCYVAQQTNLPVGRFTHYIASLHLFRKDGEGVF